LQELGLPTGAVGCDHHAPRDLGGDLLAVIGAHEVHAQVDPGGDAALVMTGSPAT